MRVLPHRLLVFPRARVEASHGPDEGACTTLHVEGLLCGLCAARVQAALESVQGVREARVDLDAGIATVQHDRGRAGVDSLARAVESAVVLRSMRRLLALLGSRTSPGPPRGES